MRAVVSKEIEWDMGHRVPDHASKCRNPHGHRYRCRVSVAGDIIRRPGDSSDGMVLDFGELKRLLVEAVAEPLDHAFAVSVDDTTMLAALMADQTWKVVRFHAAPTAENLAAAIGDRIVGDVKRLGLELVRVELWETPTSCAVLEGSTCGW